MTGESKPKYHRDNRTSVFISAILTIARVWSPIRSSSTDKWIRKMWYTCKIEFLASHKKNEIASFE